MGQLENKYKDWPRVDQYDGVIREWIKTVDDIDIRNARLDEDLMGIRRPGGANSDRYVRLYRVGNWVLRCFGRSALKVPPPPDLIEKHYNALARFYQLHSQQVSSLVPVTLCSGGGIPVHGNRYPVLKMPFVKLPSLGNFILENYKDSAIMELLCVAWRRMIRELEQAEMAHGDLDLTNVLVQQGGRNLLLRLIDYDNVWIPDLANGEQLEYGHEPFQHPAFFKPNERPYNAKMDRFSALTIYISLVLLVSHPKLYEDWGADEMHRLLFSVEDYKRVWRPQGQEMLRSVPTIHNRFMEIRRLEIPVITPYVDELRVSLRESRMPRSLDDIAHGTEQEPGLIPVSGQLLPPPILVYDEINVSVPFYEQNGHKQPVQMSPVRPPAYIVPPEKGIDQKRGEGAVTSTADEDSEVPMLDYNTQIPIPPSSMIETGLVPPPMLVDEKEGVYAPPGYSQQQQGWSQYALGYGGNNVMQTAKLADRSNSNSDAYATIPYTQDNQGQFVGMLPPQQMQSMETPLPQYRNRRVPLWIILVLVLILVAAAIVMFFLLNRH